MKSRGRELLDRAIVPEGIRGFATASSVERILVRQSVLGTLEG